MKNSILLFIFIGLSKTLTVFAQDVNFKIGVKDNIQSKILSENRSFIIHLPKNYATSNKKYPVLYVLDGSESNLIEAIQVTKNLRAEMIIVALPNTDRDRDMMPLSTSTYKVANPGAENFLSFIGNELIPHIEKNVRSNRIRTIRGRSLSGLFILYAFLKKPELFDNYIANSAGWYADMNLYFETLTDNSFQNKEQFNGKKLFIANSLADPFDPKKEIHNSILEFSNKVKTELGNRLFFKYVTYDNYGHVPYPSFYDGLKFVLQK